MRLRITGTCGLVGVLFCAVGLALQGHREYPWWCDTIGEGMWSWGLIIAAFGVLPTDRRLIYFLVLVFVISYVAGAYDVAFSDRSSSGIQLMLALEHCEHLRCTYWCALNGALSWLLVLVRVLVVFFLAHGASCLYPLALLDRFWCVIKWSHLAAAVIDVAEASLSLILRPPPVDGVPIWIISLSWVPSEVAVVAVLSVPSFRSRLHGVLASRGASVRVAAAISSLISYGDERRVLHKAQHLFRAVRCDLLTEEMLATNTPDKCLLELSQKVRLGEADVFLSHSWHDNSSAKWVALQQWRKGFVSRHGREPYVWLDKICLDQGNIDESLQCLPVFLSGCRKLLVIAGTTYPSRLWCVVELFVFLATGGKMKNLVVCPLGDAPGQVRRIGDIFESFDVHKVTSSRPEDKDRLLAFVEAGFGNLENFSSEVRRTLTQSHRGDSP